MIGSGSTHISNSGAASPKIPRYQDVPSTWNTRIREIAYTGSFNVSPYEGGDHRVVYLPDCRALYLDVFGYLQFALVLAYPGDSETKGREHLEQCQNINQLTTFYIKASS